MKRILLFAFLLFNIESYSQQIVVDIPAVQDAYVVTGLTCSRPPNSWLNNDLRVGRQGMCRYKSYIQFDFTEPNNSQNIYLPENAVIKEANLILYPISSSGSNLNHQFTLNTATWDESTINTSNAPAPMATMSGFPSPVTAPGSALASSPVVVNVTDHVKFMHCRKVNFGWQVEMANPNLNNNILSYYSSNATAGLTPVLQVVYYTKMDISFVTTPASSLFATDGKIHLDVTGGSNDRTITWYDIAGTTPPPSPVVVVDPYNLEGLTQGAYKLKIKDNNSLEEIYAYVLIGAEEEETTVILQPDNLWGKDAQVISGPGNVTGFNYTANNNYGTNVNLASGTFLFIGTTKGLIDFNYYGLDTRYELLEANLILDADVHAGNNAAHLRRVTSDWDEDCVTWAIQPTTTNANEIAIPTLPANNNLTANVFDFTKHFMVFPNEKFGFKLETDAAGSTPIRNMSFHSSDNTTLSRSPKLVLKFRYSKLYSPVVRKPDGGYYTTQRLLNFFYNEEYNDSDGKLTYNIYKADDNSIVANQSDVDLPVVFGDNFYNLDLDAISGGLPEDNYLLEVVNEKKEKFYLRFTVDL